MNLSDDTLKRVRELIVFSALLVVALWKMDAVIGVLKGIWGILFPFVLGGATGYCPAWRGPGPGPDFSA